MFVFLKTQTIGGRDRLRPLPGQIMGGNTLIDENCNCSGDKNIRSSYPIGTIFATAFLTVESSGSGKKFYRAARLIPIYIPNVQDGPQYEKNNDILEQWYRLDAHSRLADFRGELVRGVGAFRNKENPKETIYATLNSSILQSFTSGQWPESNFDYAFVFFNIGSKVWQQLPPENIEVLNYN